MKKIIKLNTLYVIGIFRNNDCDNFSILKIKKNGAKLTIEENKTFSDFESLKLSLNKKIPAILLIDGKGILNKKIDLKDDVETAWLKNLDHKSIHYSSYKTSDAEFLSFCRKNIVEEYVDNFINAEIQILDFYVGSLIGALMKDAINKDRFYSNLTLLQFAGETLIDIPKSDSNELMENYKIEETSISNYHIPLYAIAINFYINHNSITKSSIDKISSDEIIYKKAFEKVGSIILISFFALLMMSYGLIQYFISKNATINLENSYTYKSYDIIKDLEIKRDNKFKILNETGFSSRKFISYYCYELTKFTPTEVSFSSIDVYPIKKEIKKNEKAAFDYKIISFKGQTINKSVFNSWIDEIKSQKWVKTLEIVSIKRDKKDITYFELKITVSDV